MTHLRQLGERGEGCRKGDGGRVRGGGYSSMSMINR